MRALGVEGKRGVGQRLKKGRAGGGSSVRERHSAAPALLKKAAICAWLKRMADPKAVLQLKPRA